MVTNATIFVFIESDGVIAIFSAGNDDYRLQIAESLTLKPQGFQLLPRRRPSGRNARIPGQTRSHSNETWPRKVRTTFDQRVAYRDHG